MADQRSRTGAASMSIPLAVLTFVLIGVFFWWLNMNAEPTSVMLQDEGGDDPAAMPGMSGVQVTEEDLRMSPQRFEGQVVQITLPVAGNVGTQAFFLDVTDAPFLVKLSEMLVQQGQGLPQCEVTVVGPLMAMTDSIRSDWLGKGLVPAADEILVEFATHFIEAAEIRTAPVAPAAPTP